MSAFLSNANRILRNTNIKAEDVNKAKGLLKKVEEKPLDKKALLTGSTIANIIILLTPFIAYYKINQVVKLLKELEKELQKPSSEFKQYI